METYKVMMGPNTTREDAFWLVMDSGTYNKMKTALKWYRDNMPKRKFRMEKHTMIVLDD